MRELTPDERKRAMRAFSKGMVPGFALCFVGVVLNVLFARTSIAVPIASLLLIVSGMTIGLVMGLRKRRATVAALLQSKPVE